MTRISRGPRLRPHDLEDTTWKSRTPRNAILKGIALLGGGGVLLLLVLFTDLGRDVVLWSDVVAEGRDTYVEETTLD